MKKILIRTVTYLFVFVLAVASLSGCNLITTNTDKDMNQTVASVKINDQIGEDKIEKRDMVSGYMSYGYYYVAQYSYTTSQAYELVLENLIQNRVIIQQARVELANRYNTAKNASDNTEFMNYFVQNAKAGSSDITYTIGNTDTEAYRESLEKYLTDYEIAQAEYSIRQSINSMIESYKSDDEEEAEKEDETFTVRATPTKSSESDLKEYELKNKTPENDEYKAAGVVLMAQLEGKVTDSDVSALKAKYGNYYDLNLAVYKEYTIELDSLENRQAFNKAIKALKKNGLIQNDESFEITKNAEAAMKYSYFKKALISQYESLIVTKYENSLIDDVEAKLSSDVLWAQYQAEYTSQMTNYKGDISAYETALEAIDDDTFVVGNPFSGYGFVSNLLIGFTDQQKDLLNSFEGTDAEKLAYREKLLTQLYAKDQRDTWVNSSYGTYSETDGFVFDTKYFVSDAESAAYQKLSKYNGIIENATSSDEKNDSDVVETKWSFKNVSANAISFKSFLTDYVTPLTGINEVYFGSESATGKLDNYSGNDDERRKAFDDLLYAYSTDTGCLGKYYGYLYSPVTDTYVEEFAAAAKVLVNKGVGSYTIVATEYGYHIMLCTYVVDNDVYTADDRDKFNADLNGENTVAAAYKKVKTNAVTSDEISKIVNEKLNGYIENNVTKYEKTYSDLITESEDSSHSH